MIDSKILDEVLPVPELQELVDEKIAELKAEGFKITNFSSGGVFYTLLVICCRIRIELINLCRTVLNSLFLSHTNEAWLDLKLADYSKKRKPARKTQGYVTLMRNNSYTEAVRIRKGHIFKTIKDILGEELRYFVLLDTVLKQGEDAVEILVEAEKEGTRYNVPAGQITRSLTYIDGGCTVLNTEDWITQEGADIEDDDGARMRGLRSWSELSTRPIAEKYQNVAEGVSGVLFATVDDQHPRGQGTVDIIVTGTAGEATEGLLEAVRVAVGTIRGTYDDLLVKSSVTVVQPVSVAITVNDADAADGAEENAEAVIAELLKIRKGRALNELIHADIIHAIKGRNEEARNVRVTTPESDLILDRDKVIIAGKITITVERV